MPKETSAGAIIFKVVDNESHYLLLHYQSGHWEFARGHGEEGEDVETTVRREVAEETGITDLKIIPGFVGHSKLVFKRTYNLAPKDKKKAPWIVKFVTLYLAQTQTENVVLSKEHKGFVWLPYVEAHKKLLPKGRVVLKKANDFLISILPLR